MRNVHEGFGITGEAGNLRSVGLGDLLEDLLMIGASLAFASPTSSSTTEVGDGAWLKWLGPPVGMRPMSRKRLCLKEFGDWAPDAISDCD